MALLVGHFKQGDAVPPWLFSVEPTVPGIVITEVVFDDDCAVIETADAYYLVNEHVCTRAPGWIVAHISEGEVTAANFRIWSPTKPVGFCGIDQSLQPKFRLREPGSRK